MIILLSFFYFYFFLKCLYIPLSFLKFSYDLKKTYNLFTD